MEKNYQVICHMATSLDGRVAGNFFNSSKYKIYAKAYNDYIKDYHFNNVICGRVTYEVALEQKEPVDLNDYQGIKINREDYIAEELQDSYAIAIDPSGKINWPSNQFTFNEDEPKKSVVTILNESVSDAYLAFLQNKKISYIFAGKENPLSMELVLNKLHQYFAIDRFFVAGGGFVNGSFLSEDLIDEISSVIVPVVEGVSTSVSIFEYGDNKIQDFREFYLADVTRLEPDGMHVRYVKNKEQ